MEKATDLEKQKARAWLANERRSLFNSINNMRDSKNPEIVNALKLLREHLKIYNTLMELCE